MEQTFEATIEKRDKWWLSAKEEQLKKSRKT